MTEIERAYAAGLMDGEGCITCSDPDKGVPYVFVTCGMKVEAPLRWLEQKAGGKEGQTRAQTASFERSRARGAVTWSNSQRPVMARS